MSFGLCVSSPGGGMTIIARSFTKRQGRYFSAEAWVIVAVLFGWLLSFPTEGMRIHVAWHGKVHTPRRGG